jgi:hypothetical protein
MHDVACRLAAPVDAPTLSALAIQVFLGTYAEDGIGPAVAHEAHELLSPTAFDAALADPTHTFVLAERELGEFCDRCPDAASESTCSARRSPSAGTAATTASIFGRSRDSTQPRTCTASTGSASRSSARERSGGARSSSSGTSSLGSDPAGVQGVRPRFSL